MNWLRKLFTRRGAYVGSFSVKLSGEQIYIHCFESKSKKREIMMVNCDTYPNSKWETAIKRTALYQLRIQPWVYWDKKDDGIMTYKMVCDPKEEFKAKLKGDATWVIKHDQN